MNLGFPLSLSIYLSLYLSLYLALVLENRSALLLSLGRPVCLSYAGEKRRHTHTHAHMLFFSLPFSFSCFSFFYLMGLFLSSPIISCVRCTLDAVRVGG